MSKIEQTKIPVAIDEQEEIIPDIPYKYSLKRLGDGLTKRGNKVLFVEWDEKGIGKDTHREVRLETSLLLDPGFSYTWLTTTITEIVENTENKIHFKTENSEYILTINHG
jgi:hypothetical protein